MEIGAEGGKRDAAEPFQQKRLCFPEAFFECRVHSLLDEATRRFRSVADREDFRRAKRCVDVAKRDLVQVARDRPTTTMPALGTYEARLAQPCHNPAHNGRIGSHGGGQHLGGDRPWFFGHVKQHVEDAGQAAITSHVAYDVT